MGTRTNAGDRGNKTAFIGVSLSADELEPARVGTRSTLNASTQNPGYSTSPDIEEALT